MKPNTHTKIHSFFPIKVIETYLEFDTLPLIKELYNIKSHSPGVKVSNEGGFQTLDSLHTHPLFIPLVHKINQSITQITNSQSIIASMWGNISSKYNYNHAHIHDTDYIFRNNLLSGVFYLQTPINSGDITFHSPTMSEMASFEPSPNMLLIFPSSLVHAVNQNLSEEDRISLAFNSHSY